MNRQILLIDDQKDMLMVMKRELGRRAQLDIFTTDSIEQALKIVQDNTVSIVICDVNLLKDSGLVLAEILRASCPEIPVVMMSAYHSTANRERAKAVGAVAFLEKPFTVQRLLQEVGKFLPPASNELPLLEATSGVPASSHFRTEDLVQIFCLNGRSVVITLKDSKGAGGKIYLQRGAVQHAEWNGIAGEDAFQALLSLNLPELTVGEWDGPVLQTVVTSWEKLLLIAALKKDRGDHSDVSALG